MTKDLIDRIVIQLEPELAQQFIKEVTMDDIKLKALELIKPVVKETCDCGMIRLKVTIDGKYYIDYSTHFVEISREQYILLHEVLENE